ncbi:hypothetical protein BC826DRAFT_1103621 [Russula brevipes]|nr:hypothetical protein BC826DRAFT_1103621 [Russula brevipes]
MARQVGSRLAKFRQHYIDMLQLGSRSSRLTEVAMILAEHPEWDYSTRCLRLPIFSKEGGDFTSKADHITPKDWRGDTSVTNGSMDVDMLSLFGKLLVNQYDETEEDGSIDFSAPHRSSPTHPSSPRLHEGDLEDAISNEAPRNNVTSNVIIQGQKTSKAKALWHQMAHQARRSSTDCLKRVQQLPCFDVGSKLAETDVITASDSILGAPSLRVGNPIAILVECESLVVMAIAEVNRIKIASRDDLSELPIHLLDDDPTEVHDWCWSLRMEASRDNILGQHVHPINPSISVQKSGEPTFLFESTFLVTLACNLFQELTPQDRKKLPVVR